MQMQEVADILLKSGVGVLPTDTLYGLVARAVDQRAVTRLYDLKHREHKPGTVIAANIEQLVDLGLNEAQLRQAEVFWPNPLSLIIPVDENHDYLHQGLNSLPVRIPKSVELQQLLIKTGPLLTSSANLPGKPSSVNLAEARNYFGDSVDFYVDGGDYSKHLPSTVARMTADGQLEILRPGAFQL